MTEGPILSGEPTARECVAAVIEIGIALRDLAIAIGHPEYAARVGYAVQRLDHIARKEHPHESHDNAP